MALSDLATGDRRWLQKAGLPPRQLINDLADVASQVSVVI
jgi:hypothetical protein